MDNVETRGSSTPMILGIVGGVALAIGSFLTWATVSVNFDKIASALGIDPNQIPAGVRAQGTASVTGWKGGDGKWTLVAGVVVVVAAALLAMASSRRIIGIVMIVGGVVGGGLALYDATIQKNDVIDNAASQFSNIGLPGELRDYFSLSLGIGIWLCVAGGLVAIVAGIMAMASRAPSVAATADAPSGFTPPPLESDAGFGTSGVGGSLMPAVEAAAVAETPSAVEPPAMASPSPRSPAPAPPTVPPPAPEAPAPEAPAPESPPTPPLGVTPPVAEPPSVASPVDPDPGSGTGVSVDEDEPSGTP
jgi:hypothetical protein